MVRKYRYSNSELLATYRSDSNVEVGRLVLIFTVLFVLSLFVSV